MKLIHIFSAILLSFALTGMLRAQQQNPAVAPPTSAGSVPGAAQDRTLLTPPDKAHLEGDLVIGSQPGLESQIRELENKFETAVAHHDIAAFQSLLADDFVSTTPEGKVQDKNDWLKATRLDKNTYTANSYLELKIHLFAADAVVCTGVAKETGKHASGHSFTDRIRFTDTWIERNGHWQCAATHTTLLR